MTKKMKKVVILFSFLSFFMLVFMRPQLPAPSVMDSRSPSFVHQQSKLTNAIPQVEFMTEPDNPEKFRDTFCDLQGEPWYYPEHSAWQARTPYFLLAGAKKSATTSLSQYLGQHSRLNIPPSKELRFFLPKRFSEYVNNASQTLVKNARHQMWTQDYNVTQIQENETQYAFEATPGYVFQSTRSPKYVLCAAPWVKIVLILREPVNRVWSNYNFYLTNNIPLPSFDEWVQRDLELLKRQGMLPDNRHSDTFVGSNEEYQAWDSYLAKANEGPVGRSMYVVQILHWYKALQAIGRDPTKEILVVRNKDLSENPQAVLDQIYTFLGVASEPLIPEKAIEYMSSEYRNGNMSNETKRMLHEFYRPYNERLYDLLGWNDTVWKESKIKESTLPTVNAGDDNPRDGRAKNAWYRQSRSESLPVVKDTFVYGKPVYNTTAASDFLNRWCELDGVEEWYPSFNDTWLLRAPYLLIPGAKKSGTTSLAFYLMQHPKMVRARTKELQFFLNKNFRRDFVRNDDRKTLVKLARRAYEREFRKPRLQNDPSLISMDATPGYLFFSSMLPQRILCVVPWVKILIILRNPVDRAYSNYQYVVWRSGGKYKASFEQFLQVDLNALGEAGVLVNDGEAPLTIEQEDAAWNKYLGLAKEGPIGRSLYVIQLRQWCQAIRGVGRDCESQMKVVRTEDIKKDLTGEYRKIQDFLGLEYAPMKSTEPKVVNKYEPMRNDTRAMLEKLFEPYNKRLYYMLGGDWEGYWDP